MIEVTRNDIEELNDEKLRELIGLLCEAELRSFGLSPSGVTWGGDQNAKDGGVDVRIELSNPIPEVGFIPRLTTIFQVKRTNMTATSIIHEMCPNGKLRETIRQLASVDGAYIIACSQSSTSDQALRDRKNAMRKALADCPDASRIKVDFYDSNRIASWVRSHPSMILWVKDKIGCPIRGWRGYENWSGGVAQKYFLDDQIRIYYSSRGDQLTAVDGINEIRNCLHQPGSSVRLVGVSGVGKTRLVQALFDEQLGSNQLYKSQVFYTDISDDPQPSPLTLAQELVALCQRFVLIVDNCSPVLHRNLTRIVASSLVSLITVEYDIREDQPEETQVFRLEPASTDIISKLIQACFGHISQTDARALAEFSGGNARIALALSRTVDLDETLGQLKDEVLFNRLFWQRNQEDNTLLKTAEVCSLVYSFNCQTNEGEDSELQLLSSLAGMSVCEMYANSSELKRRDLVQQRGKWRAVLPHAVANRLAARALENIPLDLIRRTLETRGSERLLVSFSRRLGYLHHSEVAQSIVSDWLSPNGLLGDISNLNEQGISLLTNIAPVAPDSTLLAIERVATEADAQWFFTRQNPHYIEITRLIRHLAYDKDLFSRCARLLCQFALSESPKENTNSIRDLLKSLFYLHLSGTHATAEQRLQVIEELVQSNDLDKMELALELLDATLTAQHFSSVYSFEFGARPRDYGYSPNNPKEKHNWYKIFINYSSMLAATNSMIKQRAKVLLAGKFEQLWPGMSDELEEAAKEIIGNTGSWNEGWVAARRAKRFRGMKMDPEFLTRLGDLETILIPETLIEKARLYAISESSWDLDLLIDEDDHIDAYAMVEEVTRNLGRDVVLDNVVFHELLPELFTGNGPRLFSFGQGLADGPNPQKIWHDFRSQIGCIEDSKRNYQVLRGFLNALSKVNFELCENMLDQAVTDQILGPVFPILQTSMKISAQGIIRLKQSVEIGMASIWLFNSSSLGRIHEDLKDQDLCDLLKLIASKPGGDQVAIQILHMRLHGKSAEDISDEISVCCQELLLNFQFSRDNSNIDYKLAKVVKKCFAGKKAEPKAKILCSKLFAACREHFIYSWSYEQFIQSLASTQPLAFLDCLLEESNKNSSFTFNFVSHMDLCPLAEVKDEIIIQWCDIDPETRYPFMAQFIKPFSKLEGDKLEWTSLALQIISDCSKPEKVLNGFKRELWPRSWCGSLAAILQQRLKLFDDLLEHPNHNVVAWAAKEKAAIEMEIRYELEKEAKSEQYERFE